MRETLHRMAHAMGTLDLHASIPSVNRGPFVHELGTTLGGGH